MQEVVVSDVARVWLAAILAMAGILKGRRPGAARAYLMQRLSVSEKASSSMVIVVCGIEVALGVSLWIGLAVAEAAGITAVLLGSFTCLLAWDTGNAPSGGCGCFGMDSGRPGNRAVDIIRNVVLLGIAVFVAFAVKPSDDLNPVRDPWSVTLGLVLVAMCAVTYLAASRLLEPQETF